MKPTFEHDCNDCVFCGINENNGHDIYVCPAGDQTIISRFGNNAGDYYSLPLSMAFQVDGMPNQISPKYAQALDIAIDAGFVVQVLNDNGEHELIVDCY